MIINREKVITSTKTIMWLLLLYGVVFAIWTVFYTETGNGDNVEHIHASWLVGYGKMPYRDFFQHHNPLLWYVFAPIIKNITNIALLLNVAHAIGILAGIATFYIVFRICMEFFASQYAGLLSLLILCPPFFYVYCFNFNPDTFMALFYAFGVYKLFSYWRQPKLSNLTLSFFAFFIAFMFTQKILIVYTVLGTICLCTFYQDKTPLNHILYALILPALGVLLFIAYLYNQNALGLYWKSNYLFNHVMQNYYGDNKISVANYQVLIFSVVLACVSVLLLFFKQNRCYKTISILFVIELILRCFYFSLSPYYMLPLMIYTVCLNSVILDKIMQKSLVLIYVCLGVSVYYAWISPANYLSDRGRDRTFVRFLSQNVTPCDYVVSSYFGNQSIISKDVHYYWSILGHLDLIGSKLGIAPMPDLTNLTLKYKPKLVYGGIYWNSYEYNRGKSVPLQSISDDVLKEYYLPTKFFDIYILKPEFRKRNCYYDSQIGEWIYAN